MMIFTFDIVNNTEIVHDNAILSKLITYGNEIHIFLVIRMMILFEKEK